MIEFFKNNSGVKLNVDDLISLMDQDALDVVVDIILALDEGLIDTDDVSMANIIRNIIGESRGE